MFRGYYVSCACIVDKNGNDRKFFSLGGGEFTAEDALVPPVTFLHQNPPDRCALTLAACGGEAHCRTLVSGLQSLPVCVGEYRC